MFSLTMIMKKTALVGTIWSEVDVRDDRQISLLILSKFKQNNEQLFTLISQENRRISQDLL